MSEISIMAPLGIKLQRNSLLNYNKLEELILNKTEN